MTISTNFSNIEQLLTELIALDNWVVYKLEDRGDSKPAKVPYKPGSFGKIKAKANDRQTWGTYAQAKEDVLAGHAAGVGFQLSDTPFFGFDFDHVVDPASGEVSMGAEAYVTLLGTYTEVSPSGTGLRGIGVGTLPPGGRRKANLFGPGTEFEIYDSGRYLTITGNTLSGYPTQIISCNGNLDSLHAALFGKPKAAGTTVTIGGASLDAAPPHVTDDMILAMASKATNAAKFRKLWAGNTNGYSSASEADLALCNLLVFWCGRDAQRVDRLFRQSGLLRAKWDEQHGSQTYGEMTIAKAIGDCTDTYTWPINPNVPPAPRDPKSSDYIAALTAMGYTFRMNRCFDTVEVNGEPITDALECVIRTELRDNGYKAVGVAREAWIAHAHANRYHPVQDYLNALDWDGADHIAALAAHFTDTDRVFGEWFRYWIIGCVAKAFEIDRPENQGLYAPRTPVLVLEGPQSLGKSFFVRWLMPRELPGYFATGGIRPDDKDFRIRRATTWIWEVAELGATTRRQDVDALKDFLTAETIKEAPRYGHNDLVKPPLASYIGTVNNAGGFLSDVTGSDRFLVAELTAIDWQYSQTVDIAQLWAQAVALYRQGEPWMPPPQRLAVSRAINERFEAEDTTEARISRIFETDPDRLDWVISSEDIMREYNLALTWDNVRSALPERAQAMQIAAVLKNKFGLTKTRQTSGRRLWQWHGIRLR